MDGTVFWQRVDKSGECWLWTGARSSTGRGNLRLGDRLVQAHRAAWELSNGPVPTGLEVCHRCDNGLCVRPAHLFLGTHAENMADASRKGRLNPRRKLTVADVEAIKASTLSGRRLGAIFGVSQQRISQLRGHRQVAAA